MSLIDQAAADLQAFLGDAAGFGRSITVTDPAGSTATLTGYTADIGETIDPETGQAVSGRRASCALPIQALTDAGLGVPRGIADASSRPWVVRFNDFAGTERVYKVSEAMPDTTVGVVTCLLEAYRP